MSHAWAGEGDSPRRLHPGTILVGFLKNAPSTLIGLPAVWGMMSGRGVLWALAVAAVVGVVSLFFTWLGWRNFTYRVCDDEVVIERGVLNRSRRSIPLERIQDVSIEQKPLARLFGLALVRIETGSGEKDEGKLDSVALAEAHRLRAALRGVHRPASILDEPAEPEPELVFAMGPGRLLLYGLFNFSLVWLAAIFGVLQTASELFDIEWKMIAGIVEREARSRFSVETVAAVLGVALALGLVSGVARTFALDHGFRLTHSPGRFRRVRGLLTRSEVVVADRRIQLALVRRTVLAGRLGWNGLSFQTLGGSNDAGGRQQMAPFARAGEVAAVIATAGLPPFERPALVPVSSGHVVRAIVRHAAPLAIAAGVGGFFLPPLWFGLVLVPVVFGVALLRRRFHRYALGEASLQVMRGVLAQNDWIVPYGNIQAVTVRRGWLQRRLGIATVSVDTAGAGLTGRPQVQDVATGDAVALARGLVARS